MTGRFAAVFPWLFLLLLVAIIVWDRFDTRDTVVLDDGVEAVAGAENDGTHQPETAVDPVCGMTLRASTAYGLRHQGRDHYFCSTYCRDEVAADPEHWLAEDSERTITPDEGHLMRGIPSWMFQVSVGLVMLVSFGLFELIGGRKRSRPGPSLVHRMDAFPARSRRFRALSWAPLRFFAQVLMVALFVLIIVAGLFGNQNPAFNIAPILTWTLWWGGLIFFILYFGKLWCSICPWDAAATWIERLRFWGPRKSGLGLQLRWPRALRNIWVAVFFFVALTWIELSQGVTAVPRITAILALTMFAMTIVGVFLFERKAFCRYGCLVGRVSGLYALFSPVELRTRDADGCAGCVTQECYRGSAAGDGCPTFEYPRVMGRNTYCTLCTECVKTCPRDNITVKLRPWGADLANQARVRTDEAVLAIILLAMTGFHGLTMTSAWPRWIGSFADWTGLSYLPAFTILMAAVIVAPAVVFWVLAKLAATIARFQGTRTFFLSYAYALLPIALFYHLAHNAEHVLMEGPRLLAIASDPLGFGWNLFGTAREVFPPIVSLQGLWVLQVLFVLVGHLYGLWISERTTRRLVRDRRRAFFAQLPMLAAMILSSASSLWLLSQPMEVRVSAM